MLSHTNKGNTKSNNTNQSKTMISPDVLSEVRKREQQHKNKQQMEKDKEKYKDKKKHKDIDKHNNNYNSSIVDDTANKASGSILSPHKSVYEALKNPDLNQGIDLTTINPFRDDRNTTDDNSFNLRNIHETQFQFQFKKTSDDDANGSEINNYPNDLNLNDKNNMDFSITSWQNISYCWDESRSDSHDSNMLNSTSQFPFNMISNNNSNIISSGNNSPYLRNDPNFNSGNSPNRVDSPNVASILSSSSGQDDDEYSSDTSSTNLNSKVKPRKFLSKNDNKLIPNVDLDLNSDTELDKTVDSSTIISSFVMPKVSLLSKSDSFSEQLKTSIKVRIVGDKNNSLLNRFRSYKKVFNNFEFFVNKSEYADLLILVINSDNYMLPKITKSPCIPITLNKNDFLLTKKIPKHLKLCDPIHLNSLDDDLILLITFLNNINDIKTWRMFLQTLSLSNSENSHNTLNHSTLLDINSSLINFYNDNQSMSNDSIFNSKAFKPNPKDEGFSKNFLNKYLIAGVAVGMLSLGLMIIWKKLSTTDLLHQPSKDLAKDLTYDKHINLLESEKLELSMDHSISLKIKNIANGIESFAEIFLSNSILIIHKAKLALHELLNF